MTKAAAAGMITPDELRAAIIVQIGIDCPEMLERVKEITCGTKAAEGWVWDYHAAGDYFSGNVQITYKNSPFRHGIDFAFTPDHAIGLARLDPAEIKDACNVLIAWYSREFDPACEHYSPEPRGTASETKMEAKQ